MNQPSSRSRSHPAEAVLERVRGGASVLAVLGSSTASLDEWGRGFARLVRSRPDLTLEIYIPSTSDALIERFNQVLARLSLDEALTDLASDLPCRILLVPDIRSLDSSEGLLLARLVADFPGAATKLVVLVDRDGSDRTEILLQSLGRKVARVDLDVAPVVSGLSGAPSRSKPIAAAAEASGQRRISPDPSQPSAPTIVSVSPLRPEREQGWVELGVVTPRRPTILWLGAGALLMVILLISALVVVLLHRERGPGAAFSPALAQIDSIASVAVNPSVTSCDVDPEMIGA